MTDAAQDEEALVRAIRAGDAVVFERLFRTYYIDLWRYARVTTRSSELAEEVVDDVLAWLWEHRATWTPQSSIRAYLMRAVRNRALNAIASTRSAARIQNAAALEETPVAMSEMPESPDATIAARETAAAVWRAIDALPQDVRLIMALRWQEGRPWGEIAESVGASVAAVQMKHTRALRLLKIRLPDLLD